jgi:hypothetical protein
MWDDLQAWLAARGKSVSTLSRVQRLETAYGNLASLHETDGLAGLVASLTYSATDERERRSNPSKVPIDGNLRNGLASLKSAAQLLQTYLDERADGPLAEKAAAITLRSRAARPLRARSEPLHAVDVLAQATDAMGLNLSELVARCSVWAHPDVVADLSHSDRNATWFIGTRRGRKGEKRNDVVDAEVIDDNTMANTAIKLATVGGRHLHGFHSCHVWSQTCYDPRYHTSIANLVLLPAPLAGLSDYDTHVEAVLRYRAFELFGWHPEERARPERPTAYPAEQMWRPIGPPSDAVSRAIAKQRVDRVRRLGQGLGSSTGQDLSTP